MADTLYRQWLMLREIPRWPKMIGAATIEDRLKSQGYRISRRSIQRDLMNLSSIFPLIADEDTKPFGWSWAVDAPLLDIPGMDPHTALTFGLVERFLKDKLPRSTLKTLDPHMKRAREVLSRLPGRALKAWPDKVRVIPRGQPFLAAEIKPEVLSVVYDALLMERRFSARYAKRGSKEISGYDEVNPLGLVFRDGVVYLIATVWDYTNIIQLALHRFKSAEILDKRSQRPKGFDIDAFIDQGEFGFRLGKKPLSLKLRLRNEAAITLSETPLCRNQTLRDDAKGWQVLKATVPDTLYLRNWILSLGDFAEVIAPVSLRTKIAETARRMAASYR